MKKLLSIVLVIAMLLGIMTACGGSTETPAASTTSPSTAPSSSTPAASTSTSATPTAEAKGINVYVESIMSNLDPFSTVEYTTWYVWNQVYETLVHVEDDGSISPFLATDYSVSSDGLTYTFTIPSGVKFHNGEELKASDVAYSFNVALTKPAVNAWVFMVDHAEVTGDNTVDIVLNQLYPAFLTMVANIPIVNEKDYSTAASYYDCGIGTGPYMYRAGAVDPNTSVTVDAFPDYRLGKASIPSVTFKILSDSASAVIQFETGELDFMMIMTPSSYIPLEESGKYNCSLVTAPHTAYICFNNDIEILQNKKLRQALHYAVDKNTCIQIAYEGLAVPAELMCNESAYGADFSGMVHYNYDPEKAKQLLAEAGYPNGLDFSDYGIEMDYFAGTYHEKIAQCVQNMWEQIGVKINLRASETIGTDAINGNYGIVTQGGAFTFDMSYCSKYYTSDAIDSTNYARYHTDEVDALFKSGNASTDEATRKAAYKQICEIVSEDSPTIPIQHKQIPYVWTKALNAVVHCSNDHPYFIYEWSMN